MSEIFSDIDDMAWFQSKLLCFCFCLLICKVAGCHIVADVVVRVRGAKEEGAMKRQRERCKVENKERKQFLKDSEGAVQILTHRVVGGYQALKQAAGNALRNASGSGAVDAPVGRPFHKEGAASMKVFLYAIV